MLFIIIIQVHNEIGVLTLKMQMTKVDDTHTKILLMAYEIRLPAEVASSMQTASKYGRCVHIK